MFCMSSQLCKFFSPKWSHLCRLRLHSNAKPWNQVGTRLFSVHLLWYYGTPHWSTNQRRNPAATFNQTSGLQPQLPACDLQWTWKHHQNRTMLSPIPISCHFSLDALSTFELQTPSEEGTIICCSWSFHPSASKLPNFTQCYLVWSSRSFSQSQPMRPSCLYKISNFIDGLLAIETSSFHSKSQFTKAQASTRFAPTS